MVRSFPTAVVTLAVAAPVLLPAHQAHRVIERAWLDEEGKPLPFHGDAELMDFLRQARVLNEKSIGTGINRSRKVLLEREGIRAHAIFRQVDDRRRDRRVDERMYLSFADSYLFECAAYELAKILGLDNVPPVVLRKIGSRHGSLQIWIEDVLGEEKGNFSPPNAAMWARQAWDMYFFDNLIFNVDRNKGNYLVDKNYVLWMIDHTRAFQVVDELIQPERVTRVNRAVWERLLNLTEDDLSGALSDYLTSAEIRSLWNRRRLLIDHVERLVEQRGPEVVFY